MTRLLALGLLIVAMSPDRPVAAQSPDAPLMEEPLVQGLHVRVSNRPDGVSVDVGTDRGQSSQALQWFAETNVQVWLLKADGTALPRRRPGQEPIRVSSIAIRSGQTHHQRLLFSFETADPRDLDAVVVSVDGVLFVRRIPKTPAN